MTPGSRAAAGALAVLLGALAWTKLLDLEGYAQALAALPLVAAEHAQGAATLFVAVEGCAAALLALVALAGPHARVAFEGGAALALAAALGYAILIVSVAYVEPPKGAGALFGTRLLTRLPGPALVVFVVGLLSWSAWLLSTALLLPSEGVRRPRRGWRRLYARAFTRAG